MSATANDLQVSTTECKVIFATAAHAEYKLADGRVGMRSRTNLRDRSRPHISASLPVHTIISSPGEGREGRGEQLAVKSHRCLERQVVHCRTAPHAAVET